MALNLSHRPIFREGCSENHGERFCSPLISEGEFKDCFDYGRDRNTTGGSSQELISSGDIIGGLPPDPFGMEMNTTFTAITGWLENLEVDYFGYGGNRAGNSAWDYQLFTGLDFLWNNAMLFHALPDSVLFDCGSYVPNGIGESSRVTPSPVDGTHRCSDTMETKSHLEFGLNCGLEGFSEIKAAWGFSCHHMYESTTRFGTYANQSEISMRSDASCGVLDFPPMREIDSVSSIGFVLREGFDGCAEKIQSESVSPCCSDGDGVSHLALDFVLGFLTVKDLLSIERVCKSLKSTVRTDALLWQSIYIGHPLNEKITDDILLQLSARAQGNLKCLTLVECSRITNDCLKRVVLSNPTLTKLYVPGCTSLSISVILNILKTLQSMGILSVKHVRIGGIYGTTIDQFEELKTLLGLDCKQQHTHRPHFFQREKYLSFEDDSEIDIEICPRCQNLRLVYDCPSETCRGNLDGAVTCRACILCNPRCFQCGLCINDGEYQENFCLELLCPDCSVPGGVLHPRIV